MANLLFNQFDGNSYSSYYGDINPSINKELNFNRNRLTNIGEPIKGQDSATKNYVDSNSFSIVKVWTGESVAQGDFSTTLTNVPSNISLFLIVFHGWAASDKNFYGSMLVPPTSGNSDCYILNQTVKNGNKPCLACRTFYITTTMAHFSRGYYYSSFTEAHGSNDVCVPTDIYAIG